jgi:hypothetical protein
MREPERQQDETPAGRVECVRTRVSGDVARMSNDADGPSGWLWRWDANRLGSRSGPAR